MFPEGTQVAKGETIVVHLERVGSTSVVCQFHAKVRRVESEAAETGVRVGANFAFANAIEQRSVWVPKTRPGMLSRCFADVI
jgi:GMP synthase-like glutamine amidotransferase